MSDSSDDSDCDSRKVLLESNNSDAKRELEDNAGSLSNAIARHLRDHGGLKDFYIEKRSVGDHSFTASQHWKITVSPKLSCEIESSEKFFREFDEVAESLGVIDLLKLGWNLNKWQSEKRLAVNRLEVNKGLDNLAEFLKLVKFEHLDSLTVHAKTNQAEIFDLHLVQRTKNVSIIGVICPDDKLLKMYAERFTNRPEINLLPPGDDQTRPVFEGLKNSVLEHVNSLMPKQLNSQSAINQYIRKCVLHLNKKNHHFWLWPHDKYEIETIFSDLDLMSSKPYRFGTVYVVNSIHRDFVFMVFLLEIGIFGKRMARGSETPTLQQILS